MIRIVEECPHRVPVQEEGNGGLSMCRLLQQVTGVLDDALCRVGRDACTFCCRTRVPTPQEVNPVVASFLFGLTDRVIERNGVPGCDTAQAIAIQKWAETQLDDDPTAVEEWPVPQREVERCLYLGDEVGVRIVANATGRGRQPVFRCEHPEHSETTAEECAHCRDWSNRSGAVFVPVEQVLPVPKPRHGPAVRAWSVGVTTAPRRRPTLEWTLDSLVRAGWNQARLFVDSAVTIPQRYLHFPVTYREPRLGAWPSFYLGLAELLMRDPHADAYLMVQDDVLFQDRADLRAYLEKVLWPAERPGPVSLYCSGPTARVETGWHLHHHPWFLGAQALIFSRESAREFVIDPDVIAHRWSDFGGGMANIDTIVGRWAFRRGTPVHFPTPSLCRHTGQTSSLWPMAKLEGTRENGPFAGDRLARELLDLKAVPFPESAFPCPAASASEYALRVERGRARMRGASVAIVGVCRDVLPWLPRLAARIERLGQRFRRYHVVCHEAGSVDGTPGFLRAWARQNPAVHVLRDDTIPGRSSPREALRRYVVEYLPAHDFIILIDMDVAGGWSDDGIADSFGREGWDFLGSNGLLRDPAALVNGRASPIFFDTWSLRDVDNDDPLPDQAVHALQFERGMPLRPVWSCFGGLGIYRQECWRAVDYDHLGPGDDHVTFHRRLRERGFDRLFLNPSQIVLHDEEDDLQMDADERR